MAESDYLACKYSVTVEAADLAVLHMLRGLTQHCESGTYRQISWGGTSAAEWKKERGQVTFRFTRPQDREQFLAEAARLLTAGTWSQVRTSDDDPATPRR